MDFTMEPIASSPDADAQQISVVLKPDPRRYSKIEKDGETLYLDKFLKVAIPLSAFERGMPKQGLPMYVFDPRIKDTPTYAKSRLGALKSELNGGVYIPPQEEPSKHRPLTDKNDTRDIAFISLDICGSTKLRLENGKAFDDAFQIFLRELGTVVGEFGGSIFKVTGDGFIAFIDHPSFTRQCDNTVDLGLSLIRVLGEAVNPALSEQGLPNFNIRVGADYGEAAIRNLSVPATGFDAWDVASDALNRAVKIQETCSPNELRIGRLLYELLHVQWLERAHEIESEVGVSIGEPGYQIYSIK